MQRSEQSLAAERAAFLRRRGDDGRLLPGPIGSTKGKVPENYWCQCNPPTLQGNCTVCKQGWKDRGFPKLCLIDGTLYVEETLLPFSETPFVAGLLLTPSPASEPPAVPLHDDLRHGPLHDELAGHAPLLPFCRRRHHATATASAPRPSPLAGGRRLRAR